MRPATAAFAESEMEEVMEAMVPRCSGRKECASCAATTPRGSFSKTTHLAEVALDSYGQIVLG